MDILFFAAIALYVFWKLREQFGVVDEEEKKRIEETISRKKEIVSAVQNQVMAIQKKISEQNEAQQKLDEELISKVDPESQDAFRKILQSCAISAELFLVGAKSAFEMTIKSFASADLTTLQLLLSDKVFDVFAKAIEQRKALNQVLVTNVIAIDQVKIMSVSLQANSAVVVISFVSKQINYITDNEGQVIEGRKDEIRELNDVWTFTKDLGVPSKNWVISAT